MCTRVHFLNGIHHLKDNGINHVFSFRILAIMFLVIYSAVSDLVNKQRWRQQTELFMCGTHFDDFRRFSAETRWILHWFPDSWLRITPEQFTVCISSVAPTLLPSSFHSTIRFKHVPMLYNIANTNRAWTKHNWHSPVVRKAFVRWQQRQLSTGHWSAYNQYLNNELNGHAGW